MLKETILEFYNESSKCEEIKEYGWLKMHLLYPVTILNGNVLGIFTSITTCLSMNIFTNFISFQEGTFLDLIIWSARFIFAIILNVHVAKLSIICTIIQDKATRNSNKGMPHIERLDDLLDEYNFKYTKIRNEVIYGFISLLILSVLIIYLPIGKYIFNNWDKIGELFRFNALHFIKNCPQNLHNLNLIIPNNLFIK